MATYGETMSTPAVADGRWAAAHERVARATHGVAFLIWAAVCNAVVVGGATELTWGRTAPVQIAIAACALLAGVGAMFVLPFALFFLVAPAGEPSQARQLPVETSSSSAETAVLQPPPSASAARHALEPFLSRGRALDPDDVTVDAWVAGTRAELERYAPAFASYFAHPVPGDAAARLKRHLSRLEAIVYDSL
jgi:hypothetical protein